ncbi:p-hydroxybenzoic acid efflux pump subunit AaeB [Legionella lansingensis]|uniref:p-hydroxybenzoic acid efflux pump subunit AaeB n=1 Tax=Legionella lansingensis TaxID=45067 RepID=A0A0W0W0N6_9GAMM|nr:FUSC family protein [Legionella lansingensis]KTD25778.1 p-hydroxybenzoic acid efflux pump subunit AaeB [Legionella lansingensis]SNV52119.1 p-hydroxybenzoic acid efflux pump subunit AaeB [Legionella lansingensis]
MRIDRLIPHTLENRAALRTAIAAVSAIFIAFALHLDRPYWAGMTVVITSNLYVGSIIDKAILRVVGTIIGVSIGFLLARMVANSLFLYLVVNLLLISVAVYYYNFSSHAYSWLLGALGAFFVVAQLAINPEEAFYIALWRPIEIGLGVLVSAAAAFCIFPNRIGDNMIKDVSLIFDSVNTLLEQLEKSLLTGTPFLEETKKSNVQLKKKIKKSIEMLGFMRREFGIKKEKIDQFRALLDLFYDLARAVTYFINVYQGVKERFEFEQEMNDVFRSMYHDLTTLEKAFFASLPTSESLQTGMAIEAFNKAIEKGSHQEEKTSPYFDILSFFQQINYIFNSLGNILILHEGVDQPKNKLISRQQQLSGDPDVIQHSLKTGLAAVLALVFWIISNWPGGINGIISSIVISIRRDLFEMKNISVHRLLGCMLGGLVALFPIGFFPLDLYTLLLILFFPIWVFSYFTFKSAKYSYIGLQANIALVICLAQAGGPPTDLSPPLERFGGIIIGIFASFLVGNILWRAHPLALFKKNIKKVFAYLTANMEALFIGKGNLYDLTHLFWLTRGLMESIDEEALKPAVHVAFSVDKKNYTQLAIMQATLSQIYRSINLENAHLFATELGIEAELRSIEQELVTLYKEEKVDKREEIKHRITDYFAAIDLVPYEGTSSKALNFLGYLRALKQLLSLCSNFRETTVL